MKIIRKILFIFLSMGTIISCTKEMIKTNASNSPRVVFNQASDFVRTHSAFLGIKGLNWDSISTHYGNKVFEGMSDDSLYNLINLMLLALEDGHALLYCKNKDVTVWDYTTGYPVNFDKQLLENYYWQNSKKIGPLTVTILNNVGYVYYPSFGDKIEESHMDDLIDFIANTRGLIIDIRNNGGGDGTNSNTILSRLTDKEIYLGKQLVKSGPSQNDFIESRYILHPSENQKKYLNKKIVILTNRGNASAAAFFTGFAKVINNVISVGDRTGGAGGVGTSLQLGNGWQITVSSTLGIDANNNVIENGIEPNIRIDQTIADSLAHRDTILETALSQF
jgi:Peptidase family S41